MDKQITRAILLPGTGFVYVAQLPGNVFSLERVQIVEQTTKSSQLLEIGVEIAEYRRKQLEASEKIAQLELKHQSLCESVLGASANGKKKNGETAVASSAETPKAPRGRKAARNGAGEPLRDVILKTALALGKQFSTDEILETLSDSKEDPKRIRVCLQDMRARLKMLNKPEGKRGYWELNKEGQKEAERLMEASDAE